MATATESKRKTFRGFKVTCPMCGDAEATVKLDLNNLTECVCSSCDAEFSPREAMTKALEMLNRWTAVVRWVEMAPDAANEPEADAT